MINKCSTGLAKKNNVDLTWHQYPLVYGLFILEIHKYIKIFETNVFDTLQRLMTLRYTIFFFDVFHTILLKYLYHIWTTSIFNICCFRKHKNVEKLLFLVDYSNEYGYTLKHISIFLSISMLAFSHFLHSSHHFLVCLL